MSDNEEESSFPRIETRPYDETNRNEEEENNSSSGRSTPTSTGKPSRPGGSRRSSRASSASSRGKSGGSRSVQVIARFRPENALEVERGGVGCVNYDPSGQRVSVTMDGSKVSETHEFKFESVMPPNTTQDQVYAKIGPPIVDAIFQGINCSIAAYGATGAGKTYSMLGATNDRGQIVDQPGILPRLFNDIFDKIQKLDDTHDCVFNFSFVELYMERLRDLLSYIPLGRHRLNKTGNRRASTASTPSSPNGAAADNDNDDDTENDNNNSNSQNSSSPLLNNRKQSASNISPSAEAFIPKDVATAMKTDIGPPPRQVEHWRQMHAFGGNVSEMGSELKIQDAGNDNLYVTNTTSVWVQNQADAMTCVQKGLQYRTTAATKQNLASSRSHAILVCTLMCKDRTSLVQTQAQLYIVDLAGSERVSKSETEGLLLEEAKSINLSLFSLGNVINALAERASGKDRNRHVPLRDSKLTRLLSNSLGGNALSYIICACSPSSYNAGETVSTLTFGSKASLVKTQPKRNENLTVEELTYLLEKAKSEIEMQKAQINMLKRQLMRRNDPTENGHQQQQHPPNSPVVSYNNNGGEVIATPGTRMHQLANEKHERLIDVMKSMLSCPLTGQPMKDPVFCLDGVTYHRPAIFQHLTQNDMISPMTGQRVLMSTLTPNSTVKAVQQICEDEKLLVGDALDVTRYNTPFMAWYPIQLIVSFLNHDDRLWLATLNSQFARCVYDRGMWMEPVTNMLENASDEIKGHVKRSNLPAHKVYVMLKRYSNAPEKLHQHLQRYIISPNSSISLFSSKLEKDSKRFGSPSKK